MADQDIRIKKVWLSEKFGSDPDIRGFPEIQTSTYLTDCI